MIMVKRLSRAQARELKHQGLPGATVHRGSTNVRQSAIDKVWAAYYDDDFPSVEEALLVLRKVSPYHYREIKNQLAEDINDRCR